MMMGTWIDHAASTWIGTHVTVSSASKRVSAQVGRQLVKQIR